MCIGSKHTPKADGSTGVYTMENTTVVGGEGGQLELKKRKTNEVVVGKKEGIEKFK